MRSALRTAAALFATAVALAAGVVNGAPLPEPGTALAALEFAGAAAPFAQSSEFAGYAPADTTPDSAARPAEPLPGLGLKSATEMLVARERWALVRSVLPALARRVRPPPFARHIAAARDGTLSARSTGLPPPA